MKKILTLLSFLYLVIAINAQVIITQNLHQHWQFTQAQKNQWHTATVPGTVHTDLLANKLIDNPFYRDNETHQQWISQTDWIYKTQFEANDEVLGKQNIALQFDGLDTYCEVFLNNISILKANNMFRYWTIDVKKILQKNNTLTIYFHSPDKIADSLAKQALPLVRSCENNRHYVRKAQYHYGWDWGPKLTTSGIWKSVYLKASNEPFAQQASEPKYWNTKLVQEKDSIGTSFYFTVDGKPSFMKGANWIPCDVFLPRITHKIYRDRLVAAKKAGINMLRVWGGGIYEDDYFYTLCDSLKIYVWQDFMFAGAMYPANDPAFTKNVRQELIENIQRLQKHPCIVVWCGNNEIDEAWHNWGWKNGLKDNTQTQSTLWSEYKKLFHEVIAKVVDSLDKRPYITTSPKIGYGNPQSLKEGDSHYWGVWVMHEPIEKYAEKVPRFASEYGMQAMPNWATVKKYALLQDYDTASSVMKVHQKHPTGYQNLGIYLKQNNLQNNKNFKAYVKATQQLQSKALSTAINAHFYSNGRCMGTLFWQLNDCWPVCSWSVIDYYGGKKKAYYTVKKLYNSFK